ncbi:MAG: tryptophan 7-halogenase [Asticcacaulis sp.]
MTKAPIRSVIIAGGGTAGWMTAAALAKHFVGTPLTIRLIESAEIGTIGVGEATIPTIRSFYQSLGMNDAEVIRATQGTAKLGICFSGWREPGHDFIHPFAGYGQDFGDTGFHHILARLASEGTPQPLEAFSLGLQLARAGKFAFAPHPAPFTGAHFDWALHLDASLFAAHLRRFAESLGVERIEATIADVRTDSETGFVTGLALKDGRELTGELFIDCTGFQALLIGKILGTGYESYADWLFCDRALAVQSESKEVGKPYTLVTAREAGWTWRIPLQHRTGNGYVYSSRHTDDETALRTLTAAIPDRLLMEPRPLHFTPGRRAQAWAKNVVAIGLSSGFLEPLESTSIALIQTGIEKLKQLFPHTDFQPSLVAEYNDMSQREFERVRDFLILHYWASRRDEAFWADCRAVSLPDTLARKIELYRSRGHFVRYRWEMFHPQSWLAIYDGFGLTPDACDPAAMAPRRADIDAALKQMRDYITTTVAKAPGHADFLRWCQQQEKAA